jgi:hypothetical protein
MNPDFIGRHVLLSSDFDTKDGLEKETLETREIVGMQGRPSAHAA